MLNFLSAYDFTIEHRAGRLHSNCDALSRRPCYDSKCRYCDRIESKFSQEMVEDGSCITEESNQNMRTELDRQGSEEISENDLVGKVGCRQGAMVFPLSYADVVKGNTVEKVQEHYTNIPICFIPQVSPFYIVEKLK